MWQGAEQNSLWLFNFFRLQRPVYNNEEQGDPALSISKYRQQ